jgi:hypothetical protein
MQLRHNGSDRTKERQTAESACNSVRQVHTSSVVAAARRHHAVCCYRYVIRPLSCRFHQRRRRHLQRPPHCRLTPTLSLRTLLAHVRRPIRHHHHHHVACLSLLMRACTQQAPAGEQQRKRRAGSMLRAQPLLRDAPGATGGASAGARASAVEPGSGVQAVQR